ncbi:hypothetical protein [Pseudonocardia adelaidensis]|uniref:Uncharacterized protein n=1 Tax=Pseudonocardia adelaidensis TaxID=648754 RepID=A0ABP9NUA0_9PSEU
MTTYAYDTTSNQLVAVWDTGIGATFASVARLNAATEQSVGLLLADALTRLSTAIWMTYSAPELLDLPAAVARRALRRPNVPQAGRVRVEEHPVVESAHCVGRGLEELGSAGVRRAVIADVDRELAAASSADRGDLTGRARQAVMLTRVTPSPSQIAQADRLFHEAPAGGPRLYTEVEPSAAGVAAIHWFFAAVDVVARLGGTSVEEALHRAHEEHYFDPAVPRAVLRISSADPDRTPLLIGRTLLQAAVLQGRGMILSPCDLEPGEPYFTVLDPVRPARCLLDGLVRGIQALGALHATYLDPELDPDCDRTEPGALADRHFDAAVRGEAATRAPERMADLVAP